MTPIKINLSDSLSVTAIQTDKFKTGTISFSLVAPLTKSSSVLNMLLCGVLRRGTKLFPSAEVINRRLDELYAASIELKCPQYGKNEALIFSAEMLDNAFVSDKTDVLSGIIQVISQMFLHPLTENGAFRRDAVSKEKTNVADTIRAVMNNPKSYAAHKCNELLHRNDPDFPSLDDMLSTVANTNEKSLYQYYSDLLKGSDIRVFYVGSIDPSAVADTVRSHFAAFSGKRSALAPVSPENASPLREETENFDATQGKLCMGFRTGICATDKRYFATVVLNEIFGGSPASKLFMNVREKLGLCYYCSSSYDAYMGNILVSSGIGVENLERTKKEILSSLDDIKAGKISNTEFAAAKKSITHWHRQMYDYPSELFAFYSTRELLGDRCTVEDYIARFNAVTLSDVVSVAQTVTLDTVFFLNGVLDCNSEEYEGEDE